MFFSSADSLLEVIVRISDKMMKYPVANIHGNTLEEIQNLLLGSCELIQNDIVLDATSLGGWSNINIRGISQGHEFILKLPWSVSHYDVNPYSKLYGLLNYLSRSKLTAAPISFGRLSDRNETPFILLHYFDGRTYASIANVSRAQLQALKNTLHLLSLQKPPGLRKYVSPYDYLIEIYDEIGFNNTLARISREVQTLVRVFHEQYTRLMPRVEALGVWSGKVMHGDLWEPNMLFDNGKVILLDFESCCYGDPIYDLAYLLEASDNPPTDNNPLSLNTDQRNHVTNYRLVALLSLIGWSLNRLLVMNAGLVEKNLNTPEIKDSIAKYTRAKISRLISLTN
jgi:aminoglycoside phosphotransferase (APT) family kinase protein